MTTASGTEKKRPGNGIVFRDGRWITLCGASERPIGKYVDKSGAQIVPVKEAQHRVNW